MKSAKNVILVAAIEDYRREIFSKLLEEAWCEFLLQLESEEAPQA